MQKFCEFFGIGKGISAMIGGGGKTSTMYALADYLRTIGSVFVCTSTHIHRPPQYPFLPFVSEKLNTGEVISIGTSEGVKLTSPIQSFLELTQYADFVLVEADGSRQFPLKAHASHEPVIPEGTQTVLALIGIDGIGKPICDVAHRPELFASISNASVHDLVTEEMIRSVLETYPKVDGIVINKADDDCLVHRGLSLAKMFSVPVAITAWQTNNPIKAYWRNDR